MTQAGLRNSINLWCTELVTRFREAPNVALSRLEASYYTILDVRAKRDPEDYFQRIVADGASAGTATNKYAQILTAYQHIENNLRQNLPMPSKTTSKTDFIKSLKMAKAI